MATNSNIEFLRNTDQQNVHFLPMIVNNYDRSVELYHEIMFHSDNGEREFKDMVNEFIQLIEEKLSDTEKTMFDAKYVVFKTKIGRKISILFSSNFNGKIQ